MIRKTLIAAAAAVTLALGVGGATAPAEAGVKVYIGLPYVYHTSHRRHHARAPYHCHVRKVWRYGHWVRVKTCHRAWH
jgi:hypothetical protein